MDLNSKVILIVDDESMNRFILNKILSANNVQTLEACNGEEALQILSVNNVDIVLLDLNMPVMDGYMFLEKISTDPRYLHLSILVVSATNRGVFYKKIQEKGISAPQLKGFIEKPISIDDIKNLVNQY
jgi:CheY-like chemotaxis protein